jgi:hypothetical protein
LPFWSSVAVEIGCVGWHLERSAGHCQCLICFTLKWNQSQILLTVFGPLFCPTAICRSIFRSIQSPTPDHHFFIFATQTNQILHSSFKPDRWVRIWSINQQKDRTVVQDQLAWSRAGWLNNLISYFGFQIGCFGMMGIVSEMEIENWWKVNEK